MHGPTWRLVLIMASLTALISVILFKADEAVCQTWCRQMGAYIHCSDGHYWTRQGGFWIREDGRNTTMFLRLGDTIYSTSSEPQPNVFDSPLPLGTDLLTGSEPLGGSSSLVRRAK